MASANVEFIRSIFAAWERGDFSSTAWAHPEIEWVVADGPAPSSWKGLAGMAEGWRDFVSAWEDYRIVADEYRELDDERVLVLIHRAGRGKASGLEIERLESRGAAVFHIRSGKVTKQVMYGNRETVLSELGLNPEDDGVSVSENVRVARRWIEMINRRDRDAIGGLVHRDFELHNPWTPGGGTHSGIEAVDAFGNDFFESWERYTIEEQSVLEVGQTVVLLGQAHAEGAASGLTLDSPIAYVHTVRDGKLARTQVFLDHGQALAAAGLANDR